MNPFASDEIDRVDSIGESALIERMREWLGDASPPTPQGIGDDCSAIPAPSGKTHLLTTADPVVYKRHFDDTLTPEQVAGKLLKRNLSDIAAMGGSPRSATISFAIPNGLSIIWLQRFYASLSTEAKKYRIQITGGDTTATDDFLGAFMTLIGFAEGRILERGKAFLGSPLYVTGELGGSLLEKHHAFEPRLGEGQWLAQQPEVLSCMDLSDGLGKDCAAMVPQGLAIRLDAKSIPISDDARRASHQSGRSPLNHAINDGEDFELLFALAPSANIERFESNWRQTFDIALTRIGAIVSRDSDQPLVSIDGAANDIELTGYEHLRSS